MKKKHLFIVLILFFIGFSLSFLHRKEVKKNKSQSLIIQNQSSKREMTFEELKRIPSVPKETIKGLRNLIPLTSVLKSTEFSSKKITFYSSDKMQIKISKDEFHETFFFLEKKQLRIIFPHDEFSNRWLKRIIKLELHES